MKSMLRSRFLSVRSYCCWPVCGRFADQSGIPDPALLAMIWNPNWMPNHDAHDHGGQLTCRAIVEVFSALIRNGEKIRGIRAGRLPSRHQFLSFARPNRLRASEGVMTPMSNSDARNRLGLAKLKN